MSRRKNETTPRDNRNESKQVGGRFKCAPRTREDGASYGVWRSSDVPIARRIGREAREAFGGSRVLKARSSAAGQPANG
jgi:hypothetical protein